MGWIISTQPGLTITLALEMLDYLIAECPCEPNLGLIAPHEAKVGKLLVTTWGL